MKTKERLFDLFIHDLRGPLSIASTSANNLLNKSERYGPLTSQQKRSLGVILRNIRKSQALVQQMVQLLLSEANLFNQKEFSIQEALKDSVLEAMETILPEKAEAFCEMMKDKEFQHALESHGIIVDFTGKYCDSPFCHDPDKFRQILINLISNALKYRRSRVNVSIGGEDDLFVSVEDDGPGIPLGKEEAIFERFFQFNEKKRTEIPGLGLGLIGVKVLVEAMGGEIRFVSLKDTGTCFTIRIPTIPPVSEEKKGKQSILEGKRILAVDDEPDVLEVLEEEILESCPKCKVDKATTYKEAENLLKTNHYDIVILDIMGIRGFDLLELAVSRNFRVAMLTSHALSSEALKRSFQLKARSFLPKEKLGEIVPFLEDVLTYEYLPGWNLLYEKLKSYFNGKFGPDWEKKTGLDWDAWIKSRNH
jgi:CheY-like chemotaxis protein